MKQNFILPLRGVHYPSHLILSEPSLFIIRNCGKHGIPLPGSLIVLLRVPVHYCSEHLPKVVNCFRLQALAPQLPYPVIDGSRLDLLGSHLTEKRSHILCKEPWSHILTTFFQLWKSLRFPCVRNIGEHHERF